jgi:signal transduction histidine kinase
MSTSSNPNAGTSITRSNIELAVARCTSAYALVLYGISMPDVVAQIALHNPVWDLTFMAGIPAVILWTAVTPHPGRRLRARAGTAAILLLCSYLLWHIGLVGDGSQVESRPWSWGIAGIGIALAAVAGPARLSAIYSALFCALIIAIPVTTSGSVRSWFDTAQDALLTAVLAVVIIAPITALRHAASATDQAATEAVARFDAAAKAEAIRVERSRIDGLTHDTVLATLIAASRADSADLTEATQQSARQALFQLQNLVQNDDKTGPITTRELMNRIRAATAPFRPSFAPSVAQLPQLQIPLTVARALVQATSEAVRNSTLHAPNSLCEITTQFSIEMGGMGIRIEIRDDGPGFDTETISLERLGLRISIVQRMAEEGGQATVISNHGLGTLIRLDWQRSFTS